MSIEAYFKHTVLETKTRIAQRPLGELSDFVVTSLPKLVSAVETKQFPLTELEAHINQQLAFLDDEQVNSLLALTNRSHNGFAGQYQFDHQLDLAAFDLKMLETTLATYGLPIPTRLTELVNQFAEATQQLPMISYEDLIYVNPESDPRTFMGGDIGDSEYNFCHAHLRIERSLEAIIRCIQYAAFQLEKSKPEINRAIAELRMAVTLFEEAQVDMKAVGMAMPKEHFAVFRKFFNSHPTRGLKGPSGAFTAAIPVIDMFLIGEHLSQEHFDFLRDNELYFPRVGRQQMADSYRKISAGTTLSALIEKVGSPPALQEGLIALLQQVKEFRSQHYRNVRNQIPEALKGELVGTGGEANPRQILSGRLMEVIEEIRRLQGGQHA